MLTEWTGLKVDAKCLDPRPPQMQPPNVYPEGIPFFDARPPQDRPDRLQDDTSLQSVSGGMLAPYGVLYPNGQNQQPGALSPLNVEQSPQVLGPTILADDITFITGPVSAGSLPAPPPSSPLSQPPEDITPDPVPGPTPTPPPDAPPPPPPSPPPPPAPTPTPAPAPDPTPDPDIDMSVRQLGIYPFDNGYSADFHGAEFDTWLGKAADQWLAYTYYTGTWPDMLGAADTAIGIYPPGKPLVWSVGIAGTLEATAAGSANTYLTQLAQKFVAAQPTGTIRVRPMWEANGDWYPWSAHGRETTWIQAWKRIWTAFKAVSTRFAFDWCINHTTFYTDATGVHAIDPRTFYPGDAYVDTIGMDVYLTASDHADDTQAWAWKLDGAGYGLNWLASFAQAHKKRITFGEWGLIRSGATYLNLFANWIQANNVLWHNYFDTIDGVGNNWRISLDQFPANSAAFIAHFGVASIWTPVPVNVASFVDVHGVTQKVQTARKSYSMARHAASNSYRYEVRNGDIWTGDVGRPDEYNRAETESTTKLTIGTRYDYAFQVRTTGAFSPATILSQLHATEDAGEPGSHAEYALRNGSGARSRIMTSYVTTNGPAATIIEQTLFDASDWVSGHLYNCLLRIKPSGGAATGSLEFWRDGVKIVDQHNIRIGYPNLIGPYFKSGIYRLASPGAAGTNDFVLEIFNLAGPTTSDLSARILSPPAVPS